MPHTSRLLLLCAAATALIWGADLRTGVDAYDKGDFATALRELKPLADKGNSLAQVTLGLMYYEGKGVAQDYKEALKLYLSAADQGKAMAQLSLGFMYAAGQGVREDFVQAYMRFSLCVADPLVGTNCSKNREIVARKMTKSQITEADRLAKLWKPKARSNGTN